MDRIAPLASLRREMGAIRQTAEHAVQRRPLRVLYLSAEVAPYAKTGGLGDVGAALPKALRQQGVDVRVCLPRYGCVPEQALAPEPVMANLGVPVGERIEPVTIRSGTLAQVGAEGGQGSGVEGRVEGRVEEGDKEGVEGGVEEGGGQDSPATDHAGTYVPVYLVECERYFGREAIYGYPDDGERFIVYCRAALELCRALGWAPDVIHCHDWHTAIVPNWLQTIYKSDPLFASTVSVFTIHNLAYQGIFGYHLLQLAGIEAYGFLYPQISELANVVDLMGRGILFADAVTTVSERYAREILTPEYGERLDPLLRERQDRLFGILNGIDQEELDPRTDKYVPVNYGVESLDLRLQNKLALQREAGLPLDAEIPVAGMIGRLTSQKGLDILAAVADALLSQPVQFVILGTGDEHYHEMLRRVQQAHPNRAAVFLRFDTPLAQRIYAGSDLFLMPSRYEPCGLGQMMAMRYGSVPVVRATGGLADTVENWDPRRCSGNGFSFERYDPMDLFAAVIRALETHKYAAVWQTLQRRGMHRDFSWQGSTGRYLQVYHHALGFREQTAWPRVAHHPPPFTTRGAPQPPPLSGPRDGQR